MKKWIDATKKKPMINRICFVSVYHIPHKWSTVHLAHYTGESAGEWVIYAKQNDWETEVTHWRPIDFPDPPKQKETRL
ncbi:MAG: hypothetical protein Q4G69_14620 [Planctomycetia bacterium]|nr:hypothetical protein [Planctomycetia bacterium]